MLMVQSGLSELPASQAALFYLCPQVQKHVQDQKLLEVKHDFPFPQWITESKGEICPSLSSGRKARRRNTTHCQFVIPLNLLFSFHAIVVEHFGQQSLTYLFGCFVSLIREEDMATSRRKSLEGNDKLLVFLWRRGGFLLVWSFKIRTAGLRPAFLLSPPNPSWKQYRWYQPRRWLSQKTSGNACICLLSWQKVLPW